MPLIPTERSLAEALAPPRKDAAPTHPSNAEIDARWLVSFLNAERRKTFGLYEAPGQVAPGEASELWRDTPPTTARPPG